MITDLTDRELLDMFVSEVKRGHYDPCDDYERTPYSLWELFDEISRRMRKNT